MSSHSISRWIHKHAAAQFEHRRASGSEQVPIISFTFDDFPRSALLTGGELLESKGICATYYASLELVGQETSVGRIFGYEDLRSVIANGHELACHTYSHLSALEHTADVVAQSCGENRRRALELFPDHPLRNFSYPFGDVTLALKRCLGSVYDSCRTVQSGINRSPVDMAFLYANPVYSWQPLANLRRLIDRNAELNGWLILYTHDVCESPSRFGCTQEYFREAVSYAVESGARVIPVKEAVAQFTVLQPRSAAEPLPRGV